MYIYNVSYYRSIIIRAVYTYVGLYGSDCGSYVSFPTLFACFLGFWHPSLHILSFLLKMLFIILVSIVFFFLNAYGVNIFLKIAGILYIIMKSWNHTIINALKFVHQYFVFMYWLSFSFTYRWCIFSISLAALSVILQEVVSITVSTIQYSNGYHSIQYYYTMAFQHYLMDLMMYM